MKEVLRSLSPISDRPTKITHLGGFHERRYNPPWIDKLVARFVKRQSRGFLYSFQPFTGPKLPHRLDPWDYTIFTYSIDLGKVPIPLEALSVTTADGRNWYCPRSDIKAIHGDETYKKISAEHGAAP